MASSELLLHPVRIRIVRAFMGDRALTTSQLAAELPDVPSAGLYRHVALLTKAGVLQIVAERRVRGAVERTYTLRAAAAQLGPDDLAKMSPEDHSAAFLAFVAGLISDFDRYVASGPVDLMRDGAGYRMAGMWLSDAEYAEFARDLTAAILPRMANAPSPERKLRILATIAIPGAESAK